MLTLSGYGPRMQLRQRLRKQRRRDVGRPVAAPLSPRQEQLFRDHVGRAERMARAMHQRKIGFAEQPEDLEQFAIFGLLDCCREYNETFNDSFWGFASKRIHGAIIDGLRRTKTLQRGVRLKEGAIAIEMCSLNNLSCDQHEYVEHLEAPAVDLDARIDTERLLARCMSVLTLAEQELVRARHVDDMTWAEMAAKFGIRINEAHRRTNDAIAKARLAVQP